MLTTIIPPHKHAPVWLKMGTAELTSLLPRLQQPLGSGMSHVKTESAAMVTFLIQQWRITEPDRDSSQKLEQKTSSPVKLQQTIMFGRVRHLKIRLLDIISTPESDQSVHQM